MASWESIHMEVLITVLSPIYVVLGVICGGLQDCRYRSAEVAEFEEMGTNHRV